MLSFFCFQKLSTSPVDTLYTGRTMAVEVRKVDFLPISSLLLYETMQKKLIIGAMVLVAVFTVAGVFASFDSVNAKTGAVTGEACNSPLADVSKTCVAYRPMCEAEYGSDECCTRWVTVCMQPDLF